MSSPAPEQDSLFDLEERIRRTVELVNTLRAERDSAFAERDQARHELKKAADASASEVQKLRQEVEELRGERKHVRIRIEKLLGQMDLLSGS